MELRKSELEPDHGAGQLARRNMPAQPELSLSPTRLYRKLKLSSTKVATSHRSPMSGGQMLGNKAVQVGISSSVATVAKDKTIKVNTTTIQVQSRMVVTEPEAVKRKSRKLAWEKSVNSTRRNTLFTGHTRQRKTPDDMYDSLQRMFSQPDVLKVNVSKRINLEENRGTVKPEKINYTFIKEGKLYPQNNPSYNVYMPSSGVDKKYVKLDQNWTPPKPKEEYNNGHVKRKPKLVLEKTVRVQPINIPVQKLERTPEELERIAAMFCVEKPADAAMRRSFVAFQAVEKRASSRFGFKKDIKAAEEITEVQSLEVVSENRREESVRERRKKTRNMFVRLYRYLKQKYISRH